MKLSNKIDQVISLTERAFVSDVKHVTLKDSVMRGRIKHPRTNSVVKVIHTNGIWKEEVIKVTPKKARAIFY